MHRKKPTVKRVSSHHSLDRKPTSSIAEKARPKTVIHVKTGRLRDLDGSNLKGKETQSTQALTVTRVRRVLSTCPKTAKNSDQECSTDSDRRYRDHLFKSAKVASSEVAFTVNEKDGESEQNGLATDHHRKGKRDKKKRTSRRCIMTTTILMTLLILLIITVVLLVLLMKPSSTRTKNTTAVLRWNSTGITIAGITGSAGLSNNQLNTPVDVILDYANNLYIADYQNFRIQKYIRGSSTGQTVAGNGTMGTDPYQLNRALRVIPDSQENLYVADSNNQRVQYWTKDGQSVTTVAGKTASFGNATDRLYYPYGLALHSASGPLYIADYLNHRIMSYAFGVNNGTLVFGGNGPGTSITQLFRPIGLHYDAFTNSLIISNFAANNVVRYVLGENGWTLLAGNASGSFGATATDLHGPMEAILDPMGNMYVADRDNNRIQFYPVGQSYGTTIAGITNVNASNATTLDWPRSLRLDSQLNLYVADANNHRIQKFLRY